MAPNNAELQKQISQMIAFIDQSAKEKVEEIDANADEEYTIEKGRIIQQQRPKIMKFYEKKEKQIELQKKIYCSKLQNQARLKLLKSKEDYVSGVVEAARSRLDEVTKNVEKYKQILLKLILEALYQTMETNVLLRCRIQDVSLVKEVLPDALGLYKQNTNQDVIVEIENIYYLEAETCGGIEIISMNGRVKVTNTLELRLDSISQKLLPEIRNALFGRNINRKFID